MSAPIQHVAQAGKIKYIFWQLLLQQFVSGFQ